MKIIKLNMNDHRHHKITTKLYDQLKIPGYPWHQKGDDGITRRYGICPVCSNPVLVKALYPDKTTRTSPYGMHCNESVSDIAMINGDALEECPLYYPGKGSYYPDDKRPLTNELSQSIIKLFLEQFPHIFSVCQKVTEIPFSQAIARIMLEQYCANQGYLYRNAYTFNIPWVFLYRTESINIYGQFIKNTELIEAIRALNLPQLNITDKQQLLSINRNDDLDIQISFVNYDMKKTKIGFGMNEEITFNVAHRNRVFYEQRLPFNYELYNDQLNDPWPQNSERNRNLNGITNKIMGNLIQT